MAKKKVNPNIDEENRKIFAFLASFFTIIGFIIAIILWKDDEYIMFYAKQGLVLFIGFLIASLITWIPPIGWISWIFVLILWIMVWINALSGKQKNTLIVTELAEKIKL